MPFKLRLKKSRQYNVVSKSLFVICIELLDSSSTECTLTSESTGRECLENVCQRLGLQQTEFFGLRYVSKAGAPRWIELERPLKRQLDKYAKDNSLYLRVMYYVTGISLITDEMTRYHYFLQLKNDIIEGRIQCNLDEAVLLASYCMQAEFGNYNSERHTLEYLKDFALFPKDLVENGHNGLLERLTDAVIQQHSALVGLSQGTAEEYYILAAQQLEGYGQETFLVKDEHGLETILGVTLKGIIVSGSTSVKFYKWADIANVLNHKKNFGIETSSADENIVNFVFPDVDSAKYVFRMCVHQHTFYMTYEASEDDNEGSGGERNSGRLFQNVDSALMSSREELDDVMPAATVGSVSSMGVRSVEHLLASREILASRENLVELNERTASNLDLVDGNTQDIDRLRSLLPSYRPAPDYETAIQQKYNSGAEHPMYSSQPEIHSFPDVTQHYGQRNVLHTYSTPDLEKQMYMLHVFKSPPPYPISNSTPDLASQSTPDLAVTSTAHSIHMNNAHILNAQVSGSSPDLVSSRSLNHAYGNQQIHQHYPETHRTYTNLANILQQQQQSQLLEDKAVMYHYLNNNNSEANNMLMQYLKNKTNLDVSNRLAATNRLAQANPSHEPIYENVPLPWQQTSKQNTTTTINNLNEQSPLNVNSMVNVNKASHIVQRTNSVETNATSHQSSRKSSSNSNKILEEIAKSVELSAQAAAAAGLGGVKEMARTSERLSGGNRTVIEVNNVNAEHARHVAKDAEHARNVAKQLEIEANAAAAGRRLELEQNTSKLVEASRIHQDSTKLSGRTNIMLDNAHIGHSTSGTAVSSNHTVAGGVTNINISSGSGVEASTDVVDGKNVVSISKLLSDTKLGDTSNELPLQVVDRQRARSVKVMDKPVQMLSSSSSSGNYSGERNESKLMSNDAKSGNSQNPTSLHSLHSQITGDRNVQSSDIRNVPSLHGDARATDNRNVLLNSKPQPIHVYTNPALDTSNMSADSTLSATGSSHTNTSTNTNTAEKKKKKWSGFLTGGSSSSKSKTSSLPRNDAKSKTPAPTVMSKEAMCQLLERKLSDQQLFFEFEKIPKIPKQNPDFSSALHPDNATRNRYKDILPYEENRVRLSAKRDNKHGYINASHLTATVGSEQRFYIAAQSPLANTVENFWEMVWEANVYLVINLVEASAEGTISYIPAKASKIIDVGEFRITKTLSQETGHCVTCKLTLSHLGSKRHRSVWHLTYTNWNVTNNTPNSVSHFLGFLEEISSIREHVVTEIPLGHNRNPPSLIHCSDGVEKTGVTILCDLLLDMLDHNQTVDVPRILLSLRQQRMKLTSNVVQYSFLHSLLVYYLKHSRLI
uniref:protein-tyrosine-phosphatase n=1 Tax=Cacopsylla melanoneura TaxID=428564 RepID=A0A8D8ZH34_9HEMI